MMETLISESDFELVKKFIFERSGIDLPITKRAMVSARLAKRLRHYQLETFADYINIVSAKENSQERLILTDLLTTNETYFFREKAHFEFLKKDYLPQLNANAAIRVWSAAASTGEEAYSIAMLLADQIGIYKKWEVFGSDICTQVIKTARSGHYTMERIDGIPEDYLKKFCFKGTGPYAGTLLIDPALQKKVSFKQMNLNAKLPDVGRFEVVFLRNILIYFNPDTKKQIVNRVASLLKPGGILFIGHSETLKGVTDLVRQIRPTIYQKL